MRIPPYRTALIVCAVIVAGWLVGCGSDRRGTVPDASVSDTAAPLRIVSLAPNITETLFALGLGDRVVGVTRFDTFPPDAREKPKVGGYLDLNYEAVAALRPDLVLLLPEHEEARAFLDELGIRHETLHNRSVAEIIGTVTRIGELCGVPERAGALADSLNGRIAAIREAVAGTPPPRVLVVIGRTMGEGALRNVTVAGTSSIYDELLRIAGGVNAWEGGIVDYPELSAEGLLRIAPDMIVDLIPDATADTVEVMTEWRTVPGLRVADEGQVRIIAGDAAFIPGPRIVALVAVLAAMFHPDRFGD